jgi:hypothetical protein
MESLESLEDSWLIQPLCVPESERRCIRALVATLTLGLLLSAGWAFAGEVEVTMVSYEREAKAAGSFYVRVRVANHGTVPVRPCDTSVDQVPETESCLAVAYRKDKRPPRLSFSRVEVVPRLDWNVRLAPDYLSSPALESILPGEIVEASVPIPTSRSTGKYLVYVYLVTGEGGKFLWKEFPLTLNIKRPAPDVTRRILVTRGLLALYVLGTVGMIWWVCRTSGTRRTG